jgi:hypothetical protein
MNTETAQEYLNQYSNAVARLQDKKEELMMVQEKHGISSAGLDANKVQTSPRQDKLESLAIDIVTMERDVEVMEQTVKQIEEDIRAMIELIDDWRLRRILLWKYILNKDWRSIASSIGRDYKYTVNELHSKALIALINVKSV